MSNVKWQYQGIGAVLASGGLRVPKHQREYSWKKEHVEELCKDFSGGMQGAGDYFLGTIVLTSGSPGAFEVVDGQQRLATATMMLAALRDIHLKRGEKDLADAIQSEFLSRFDPDEEQLTTKLILNVKDNAYFKDRVVCPPTDGHRKAVKATCPSNRKIDEAARIVRSHLEDSFREFTEKGKKDKLKEWAKFIKFQAKVITIEVEDSLSAYIMFETLNDRGLKVSKADLVKNYVFGLSGDERIAEAEAKWTSMISSLASIGEDDDVIDFLRIYCCLPYGLTRERQVFKRVKDNVSTANAAIRFVEALEISSHDYVAMLNPEHPKWNDYPEDMKRSIRTLRLFNVTQIHSLMLAVSQHFGRAEATKAFRLFISWIVRLFVAGAGKVGRVEEDYANLATEIHAKREIKKASQLAERLNPVLPSDKDFQHGFEIAHVSKESLARYYLDAMERQFRLDDNKPELVPNDDTAHVNLEHVLPDNPHNNWPDLDAETCNQYHNRIGNLVLLNAKKNAALGNAKYDDKKQTLSDAPFELTKGAGKKSKWGAHEIEERQKKLAEIAVKTWSIETD